MRNLTYMNRLVILLLAFGMLVVTSASAEDNPRPKAVFKDCLDCPEMVPLAGGVFKMGSYSGDDDEQPVHTVAVQAFAIGKTEVTHAQWRAVMGRNLPYENRCGANCPAEPVSWQDAQEFIERLGQKTGQTYRLPTEAEWEYACQAGSRNLYCGGNDVDAAGWYGSRAKPVGNSGDGANPVAQRQANAWGLYDMTGNVREWTQDCWNDSYNAAPTDGSAWSTGDCTQRVLRGGSYLLGSESQRATARAKSQVNTSDRYRGYGFRVVRVLPD